MSGKENIIANILQGAEEEKAAILRAAQEQIDSIEQADAQYCAALLAETEEKAAKEHVSTVERYISVANMDVKKLLLKAKREQISAVLQQAEQAVLSLEQGAYNRFLIGLMEKYAEPGDRAVFASTERDRAAEAIAYAQAHGYATRTDGDFSGGLMLEGDKFDKNLTLPMLLKEYSESKEGEIAAILGD